jgi:CheY-like chemotaxis protein
MLPEIKARSYTMAAQKSILIIDDEPDTLTYFSSLLRDEGFETRIAENGDRGIEMVREKRPDLITLDVTMPESSGVRCYRELRSHEEWKSIPVVMITGVSDKFRGFISSRKQVPPPDGYLAKPVDEKEMLELIHKLLADQ